MLQNYGGATRALRSSLTIGQRTRDTLSAVFLFCVYEVRERIYDLLYSTAR